MEGKEEAEREDGGGREERGDGWFSCPAHCFIGQGWAVSHGHSSTARIETQPGQTSTIAFCGRDADGRSTQFSAVEAGPAWPGQRKGKHSVFKG